MEHYQHIVFSFWYQGCILCRCVFWYECYQSVERFLLLSKDIMFIYYIKSLLPIHIKYLLSIIIKSTLLVTPSRFWECSFQSIVITSLLSNFHEIFFFCPNLFSIFLQLIMGSRTWHFSQHNPAYYDKYACSHRYSLRLTVSTGPYGFPHCKWAATTWKSPPPPSLRFEHVNWHALSSRIHVKWTCW